MFRSGLILALLLLQCSACDMAPEHKRATRLDTRAGQGSLPWKGDGFGLTLADLDRDGRNDILAVSHADNHLRPFLQQEPRIFSQSTDYDGVGFHPGNVISWTASPDVLIEAAEGNGKIRALGWNASLQTFDMLSEREEKMARFVSEFNWPGWGASLAVSPYLNGYIILLQGYNPTSPQTAVRHVVPLSNYLHTIRAAERITVADLENDGVPELLLAVSVTNQVMVVRYPGSADQGPVRPLMAEVLYEDEKWGMPNEVQVADLDGDGLAEILVPDEAAPSQIHILSQRESGRYKEVNAWDFPGTEGVMEFRLTRERDGNRYGLAAGPGKIAIYQIPEIQALDEKPAIQEITWTKAGDFPMDMQVSDLDGDGWQDLIMTRSISDHNVWIVYGPLWERFRTLSEQGFELN